MHILLLGATGRTGQYVLGEALTRQHQITALVRNADSIPRRNEVTFVAGDPRDPASLSAALEGVDIVVSCLGQRSKSDADLLTDSAAALVKALRARPEIPCLVLSQGLLFPSKNPFVALLRLFLRRYVRDSEGMESTFRNSDLSWEIIRPPRLKDSSRLHGYSIAINAMPRGPASMERRDLALYLVHEVESRSHLREIVGITAFDPRKIKPVGQAQ